MHRTLLAGAFLLICSVTVGGCGSSKPLDDVADDPLAPPPEPPPNERPRAAFSPTTTSGIAPLDVSFDATGSFDRDGEVVAYTWSFGDGVTDSGVVLDHTFAAAGEYEVELTVTDNEGATSTARTSISVRAQTGFELSGSLQILSSSAADWDVNDQSTTPVSNNSFASAQDLLNPVTLGGFVNVPGAGAPGGNSTVAGDAVDVFKVVMGGGEAIVLAIGDHHTGNDLDLRLWDQDQNLVDASLGASATEAITVEHPGTYFVEVVAFTGASNYVMSIGRAAPDTAAMSWKASSDFVPYQALFRRRDGVNASSAATVQTVTTSRRVHLGTLPRANATAAGFAAPHFLGTARSGLRDKHDTLLALKRLAASEEIESAEPNFIRRAHLTPGDEYAGLQWHYDTISLPPAWDLTTGAASVAVAVIDTGVRLDHPDLREQLDSGFDFISDPAMGNDTDGVDPDPNDPGDLLHSGASSFHGTHVAGTIAATTDNDIGVAGTAWNTRIVPLRVLGVGGGTSFDIMQAVQHAAGMASTAPQPLPEPVDVINLSLGGSAFSEIERQLYADVRARGVIVIASAGNNASSTPVYPAGYEDVISVSATTITNTLAPYSNTGSTIDVAAPGGNSSTDLNGDGFGDGVFSTAATDANGVIQLGYGPLSGTSMAAPHVAGVVSLMKALHPEMTPAEFELALAAGDLTDDFGPPGRDDQYGHGLINAQKAATAAIAMATGNSPDPGPAIAVSPTSASFGAVNANLSISVSNAGVAGPVINRVSASASWLSVTATDVDANGFGRYALTVDRSGLADTVYVANVAFESDVGDVTLPVTMQVSSLELDPDAGHHYVLLRDVGSGATIAQTNAARVDGAYVFTLSNIPQGEYQLVAGTDQDDDFFICDAGEACGAYPTLDQFESIEVAADRAGLDFATGFRANLSSQSTDETNSKSSNAFARIATTEELADDPVATEPKKVAVR